MTIQMPVDTMTLIVIALILLGIGLIALSMTSGLSLPFFDQIAKLIQGLGIGGSA
ncbi:MAG: hypothetical protein V1887_00960 [Candidatus Aenigmatarchaeota archaeon]